MGFLNRKYKTPQEYKPISKKGQNGIFYFMIGLILFTIIYILSFYL